MTIIYCKTDESPLMAWHSLSPIIKSFSREVDLEIEELDVSLCRLIMSEFGCEGVGRETGSSLQAVLGSIVSNPGSIVIKPPCISANAVQLDAAVTELQDAGVRLIAGRWAPPKQGDSWTDAKYKRSMGSTINKLLRQGTMVRQLESLRPATFYAAKSVAPPAIEAPCHVDSMTSGDFRSTEHSLSAVRQQTLRIEFVNENGQASILKDDVEVGAGSVASFSAMHRNELRRFIIDALQDAKVRRLAFSLQLKCNVFKADEWIYAEAVKAYYRNVYEQFGDALDELGVNPALGLNAVANSAHHLAAPTLFRQSIRSAELDGPSLAINPGEPISHLHVRTSSSVARAMADAIVRGGRLFSHRGTCCNAKFVIPDRSCSDFYESLIDDFKAFGLLRPDQIQHILIAGLTKASAEEYGAQETTFDLAIGGTVRVVDDRGTIVSEHKMQFGGIWRMMSASASAIDDWLDVTIRKAREMRCPAVFWLDRDRPYHREIINQVDSALSRVRSEGLDLRIMETRAATRFVLEQIRAGHRVIAAVGNVLRDYLSEMLFALAGPNKHNVQSYCRLPNGGHLFEVGTGGTAPRIFQQFLKENFLRWNPTPEAWAFAGAYRQAARARNDRRIDTVAAGLEHAIGLIRLMIADSASAVDTRILHFFLAKHWAKWVSAHLSDQGRFSQIANELRKHQKQVLQELVSFIGKPIDLGGYYLVNDAAAWEAMRPSTIFNTIFDDQ